MVEQLFNVNIITEDPLQYAATTALDALKPTQNA